MTTVAMRAHEVPILTIGGGRSRCFRINHALGTLRGDLAKPCVLILLEHGVGDFNVQQFSKTSQKKSVAGTVGLVGGIALGVGLSVSA